MATRNDDPELFEDLRGLDLTQIDLDDVDLDPERPRSRTGSVATLVVLIAAAGALLWFPNTELYQLNAQNSWVFFGGCAGALVLALLLGRTGWGLLEDWAARSARRRAGARKSKPRARPASALVRWLTLLAALAGGGAILFGVPATDVVQGDGSLSGRWFLIAGAAVVVGVLLGRWLLMQGQAAPDRPRFRLKVNLPSWSKWVTLALLVGAGLFAIYGATFFASDGGRAVEFGLSTVGFLVGIMAAVWLVRRFEEVERAGPGHGPKR